MFLGAVDTLVATYQAARSGWWKVGGGGVGRVLADFLRFVSSFCDFMSFVSCTLGVVFCACRIVVCVCNRVVISAVFRIVCEYASKMRDAETRLRRASMIWWLAAKIVPNFYAHWHGACMVNMARLFPMPNICKKIEKSFFIFCFFLDVKSVGKYTCFMLESSHQSGHGARDVRVATGTPTRF